MVNGQTVGLCPQFTFSSSTNRITTSGYTYDAAGNMTNDSVHAYTWDAEGRLVKVDAGSTATYTYDALGQRVYGVVGANPEIFYMYDPAGNLLYATMTDGWGGDELTEPVAGRVLASYVNGQSDTYFKHANPLGSWGLITAQDGSVPQDQLYYPWGQTWTSGHYLFESNWAAMSWYNAESDLFLTPARSYGSRLERWMSPDPLGGDVTNPQSLNRYAYVLNNPASMIDPSGLDPAACQDPMYATSHAECRSDPVCGYFSMQCGGPWGIPPGPAGGGQSGGGDTSIPGGPIAQGGPGMPGFPGNADQPDNIICTIEDGQLTCREIDITVILGNSGSSALPKIIAGGLAGALLTLVPKGYYWNPIDQATNPYHSGQWSFRQILGSACSTQVTVSKATGQVTSHVDTVNPVPGWALLVPTLAPTIWAVHFAGHAIFDMGGLFPASEACM